MTDKYGTTSQTWGILATLFPATAIHANDTGTGQTAVTGLGATGLATITLIVSAKSLAGGGLLNLYLQYSPDGGTTWDDIASFTQIANAAVSNGTYTIYLNAAGGANAKDAVIATGTLTANNIKQCDWCDRVRLYTKAASFGVNDTVTIAVTGFFK